MSDSTAHDMPRTAWHGHDTDRRETRAAPRTGEPRHDQARATETVFAVPRQRRARHVPHHWLALTLVAVAAVARV